MKRYLFIAAMMICTLGMTAQRTYYKAEIKPATVQLRTNALYYLALSPNVGMEIQTGSGIAWQFDYIGAWWNKAREHRYFSNYAFQTEVRYYLAKNLRQPRPYTGHHFGIYGQLATFDYEFGGTGYQCPNLDGSWGVGISYGYTLPLSKHWSLDLTAGAGYFQSKYMQYVPYEDIYVSTSYKKISWIGPTRLEAAFVWTINGKNKKYIKAYEDKDVF